MRIGRSVLLVLGALLLLWPALAQAKKPKSPAVEIQKGDGYLVEVSFPVATPKGGEVSLKVRPAKGLKINQEPGAPLELSVLPPKGVNPEAKHLGREAAKQKANEVSFRLPYTREESCGERLPMPFELAFTLCSGGNCFIRRHKGQLAIPRGENPPEKPQKALKPKKPEAPQAPKTFKAPKA